MCTEWWSEMTDSGGDSRAVWMDLIAQSWTLKNGYNGQFYVYFTSHTKKPHKNKYKISGFCLGLVIPDSRNMRTGVR